MNGTLSKQLQSKNNITKLSKDCFVRFSPVKLTFGANFTQKDRSFNVKALTAKEMRRDIFGNSRKGGPNLQDDMLDNFESTKAVPSDNPVYEDPRDVIGDKSFKPVRKRTVSGQCTASPKMNRESKVVIKEYKRKLTKKYENLIMTLMERCENNVILITEKESQLAKLKEKLKTVLEYNKLFADENDQLKSQHTTVVSYVEDCKQIIEDLQTRNKDLDIRNKELGQKIKQYDLPDRDNAEASTAIPLVEVCMSCSSREIMLRQARDHSTRLQQDMHALKDVLYRLNLQLSRYQTKLRSNCQSMARDNHEAPPAHRAGQSDPTALDSLLTNSMGYKQQGSDHADDHRSGKSGLESGSDPIHTGRVVDLSGLLSAQALGPLFDAYQESIQEKESLILDYEKQFEGINRKTKQVVAENKDLKEKLLHFEDENTSLRQSVKKLCVEKDALDLERTTLLDRCERVEAKLKEVYELYEDKMAAMMRDYETVHREYFATKSALSLADGKIASLDAALRAPAPRTVPADLHERRVDNCKRLLEDLKHQYSMDTERKNELISRLQHEKGDAEEKLKKFTAEYEQVKEELKGALENVRVYRKAAVIFRQRLKSNMATMNTLRRSHRRNRALVRHSTNEPQATSAFNKMEEIKEEIKGVKARAYSSLRELERRVRAAEARGEARRRDLERAHLLLRHKERLIQRLVHQVADVEEIRLSQSSAHHLQGFPEQSPERTPPEDVRERRESGVILSPGPGGYFQDFGREVLK